MNSDEDLARYVEKIPRPTLTTGDQEELEAETPAITSLACVGDATPGLTVSEIEESLECMDDESTRDELEKDCLVFSSTLKQISKNEDAGYLLIFDVPENAREEVAKLVAIGSKVFYLTIL